MVSALVHGNELCGAWALKDLLASGLRPSRGSLTLAFCNLDAFDRFDLASHDASRFVQEDMNRVWSAERLEDAGTADRRRAAPLRPWVERADWLLDLHSMHEPGEPLLLTGILPRNIALAQRLKAPRHVIVDAGHKDGVRMRDFAQFGDPAGQARTADRMRLPWRSGFARRGSRHGGAHAARIRRCRCGGPAGGLAAGRPCRPARPGSHRCRGRAVDGLALSEDWTGLETLERAGTVLGWADASPSSRPTTAAPWSCPRYASSSPA